MNDPFSSPTNAHHAALVDEDDYVCDPSRKMDRKLADIKELMQQRRLKMQSIGPSDRNFVPGLPFRLEDLPLDIQLLVADHLDAQTRLTLSCVNKYFRDMLPELVPLQQRHSISQLLEIETWPCYNGHFPLRNSCAIPVPRLNAYACSECLCLRGIQCFLRHQIQGDYAKIKPRIPESPASKTLSYYSQSYYKYHDDAERQAIAQGGSDRPMTFNEIPYHNKDLRHARRCIRCISKGNRAQFLASKAQEFAIAGPGAGWGRFCISCRSFKKNIDVQGNPPANHRSYRWGACCQCIGKFLWYHNRHPRPADSTEWQKALDAFNGVVPSNAELQGRKLVVCPQREWRWGPKKILPVYGWYLPGEKPGATQNIVQKEFLDSNPGDEISQARNFRPYEQVLAIMSRLDIGSGEALQEQHPPQAQSSQ